MRMIIVNDYEEMSKKAADMIAAQILLKPNSVLGFATGSTPGGTYKHLIELYRNKTISFEHVTTVNLDEYIGLSRESKNSYYYYMHDKLFNHIDIKKENVHIPDGMAKALEKECIEYEEIISRNNGIDLQLLGIGNNGHIGFNEPDINFEAETHCIKLDADTIQANSRFFSTKETTPKRAITMGIKTIMSARKIILLANGKEKAETVQKAIRGKIDPNIPASVLQLHPDVTLILEKEAACLIERR